MLLPLSGSMNKQSKKLTEAGSSDFDLHYLSSKKVGAGTNTNKTKSRHQNSGQNHHIKINNRSFENVAQFKYLGTTVKNRNLIQEEIKKRLNSDNARYHSIKNLFCLLVCCLET
jgi:hypothetical protein